jgi:hypothetical protein
VKIEARLMLVDNKYVYPDVDLCKYGIFEVILQCLHDNVDRVAECMTNECMWSHLHVWPYFIDEAAMLIFSVWLYDFFYHLFHTHICTVGLHDLFEKIDEELQAHTLVSQSIHWSAGRRFDFPDLRCTTKVLI